MRLAAPLLAIGLALLPAAPAVADAVNVEAVADALDERPVFAQQDAKPGLTEGEVRELVERIQERNPARIQIAVFRADSTRDSGGLLELTNAIDQALLRSGTLIATAGSEYHVITTYPQSARTAAAVRVAVNREADGDLPAQLAAAVDAVTEVDPGPSSDIGGPPPDDSGSSSIDDVTDTVQLVMVLSAILVALPFVIWGLRVLLRARRRRGEYREELELELESLREQLSSVSDDIVALDLDVSMPDADARGKAAYEAALALHDRAGRQLQGASSRRRLELARATLAEARGLMDEAKRRLAGDPA